MPKASDLTVLLVDDQASMRGLARYALEQMGVRNVVEAKGGRDALMKLQDCSVSVIVSDWNMEDVDGLTLLKVVRKHPKTASTPFIMATGQSEREHVNQAIAAGCDNYLVKPFDVTALRKKLETVLGPIT